MKKPRKPRQASKPREAISAKSPGNVPPEVPGSDSRQVRFEATIGNFKREGPGISFTIRTAPGDEGMWPDGFDPWSFEPRDLIEILSLPPVAQAAFAGAQVILERREKILSSGPALLQAIAIVAKNRLVMPDWMATAYLERFLRVERLEVGSLDEAFGPLPTEFRGNMRRANERRRRNLIPKISKWLIDKLNEHPERAIDKDLFAEAGRAFNIGATQAEELYREGIEKRGMQDIRDMKEVKLFPFKKR